MLDHRRYRAERWLSAPRPFSATLEKIVLHSFEPVPGQEGEMAASPHGKRALVAINDLKRIYGMDSICTPSVSSRARTSPSKRRLR